MIKIQKIASTTHSFAPSETMNLEKDGLWLLKKGVVKTVTSTSEGNIIVLGYWGVGDVIGQPLSAVDPFRVECLTPVEATYIPLHQLNWFADAVRRYVQQTEELLCIVRSEQTAEKLHKVLTWLARKFGRPVREGQSIELPLTHQELAEVIGTTRVTVTRLINQFEKEGLIFRPRRKYIVMRSLRSG